MTFHPPEAAFRSIVCAVDFSRHSAMALRYAAALRRTSRAHLVVVYAVDPLLSAAAAAAYDSRTIKGNVLLELRRFVRRTLGAGATATLSCEVVVGRSARAILAAADRLEADLIVAGTHGLSGVKKVFFGSTTEALLRRSPVPILAVPRRCQKPLPDWPQRAIMAAAGDSPDELAAVAKASGADLLLVNVPASKGLRRIAQRSLAYRMLCAARCPVLVLPQRTTRSRPAGSSRRLHHAA
jgi:nucleotide-binding universal stress UspA family protein